MTSRRFLFFDDGSCVGIFSSASSSSSSSGSPSQKGSAPSSSSPPSSSSIGNHHVSAVLLSATGEFVNIVTSTATHCHLTRFTPGKFAGHVQAVLAFRNRHALDPYLCERFAPSSSSSPSSSSDVPRDQVTALWPSILLENEPEAEAEAKVEVDSPATEAEWDAFDSLDGKCRISVCPYGKRVKRNATALYLRDKLIETGQRGPTQLQPAASTKLESLYSSFFAPPADTSLLHYRNLDRRGLGQLDSIRTALPHSFTAPAPDSTRALAFFKDMLLESSLLKDAAVYPNTNTNIGSGSVVTVERLDMEGGKSFTFLLSGGARFIGERAGAREGRGGDVTVDCWLHAEEQGAVVSTGSGTGGLEGMILSLRGDLFSLYCPSHPQGLDMHVSLLHLDDSFLGSFGAGSGSHEASVSAMSSSGSAAGPRTSPPKVTFKLSSDAAEAAGLMIPIAAGAGRILWVLRAQALRLVRFRTYLERNRASLPAPTLPQPLRAHSVSEFGEPIPDDSTNTCSDGSFWLPDAGKREPITLETHAGRFAALTDLSGSGAIVSVRGRFPDRSMVALCLQTRTVSVILSDGRAATYSLEACLEASNSDELYDELTAEYTRPFRCDLVGPPPIMALHVRSLLAFYRYAQAPHDQRINLMQEQERASSVASAAALQSQRFLLIGAIQGIPTPLTSSSPTNSTTSENTPRASILYARDSNYSHQDATLASALLKERLVCRGSDCAVSVIEQARSFASSSSSHAVFIPPSPPSRGSTQPLVPLQAAPLSHTTSHIHLLSTNMSSASILEMSMTSGGVRVDPRLALAAHNTNVRQIAKHQIEACKSFLRTAESMTSATATN